MLKIRRSHDRPHTWGDGARRETCYLEGHEKHVCHVCYWLMVCWLRIVLILNCNSCNCRNWFRLISAYYVGLVRFKHLKTTGMLRHHVTIPCLHVYEAILCAILILQTLCYWRGHIIYRDYIFENLSYAILFPHLCFSNLRIHKQTHVCKHYKQYIIWFWDSGH